MAQRVRWKLGENEVEVEGSDRFIEKQLKRFFDKIGVTHQVTPSSSLRRLATAPKPGKTPAPAEYYRLKRPEGGTEILLILGKYLEDHRSQGQFTRKEINKLAAEARIKDVHSQYFIYAVKQGLLRTAGKGSYALTISGEDAVSAMPSQAKAD
jgi:hypothetical protein